MVRVLPISVLLVAALAGCTPIGQFAGQGGDDPATGPTASVSPTPTASAEPGSGDCDDAVITEPGEYHLPDCINVTIDGSEIEVNAGSIQNLTVRGAANEVDAGDVGQLIIVGGVNDVDTLDVGSIDITGNFNDLEVHGSVGRVAVDGHDNDVLADGDIGAVEDRGENNVIGSTP